MIRRVPLVAALASVLLVGVSCGVSEQRQARSVDDSAVPFALLDPDAPPLLGAPAPGGEPVELCFLEGGDVVVVGSTVDDADDLTALVAALAEPPTGQGPGLRSALGEPTLVREVELVGGVARVDLSPAIVSLGSDEQLAAIAQLVCTLTGRPGVGTVSFTLEGRTIEVPRGDGTLTDEPVARDDFAELQR